MGKKLDKYELLRTLGKGAFAKVKLGRHDETGELFAIKIMLQNKGTSAELEEAQKQIVNEVEKLSSLNHPYVLNVVETVKEGKVENPDGSTKDVLYTVLELATGGEMFDFLMETGKFGPKLARYFFRQMIEGLHHIHQGGLTHRDLKPENILFDANFNVKIADFGFAAPLEGNDGSGVQRTYLGTPFYMAPEIHEKKTYSGESVDVFALGIILFIMMAQNPPYRVADRRSDKLYQFMSMGKEKFFWKLHGRQLPEGEGYFTPEFKDLFEKMMRYEPSERLSIPDIVNHPWYQQDACTPEEAVAELKKRREVIQAAKERERQEKAARQNQSRARAYRGGNKGDLNEADLQKILSEERTLDTANIEFDPSTTEAVMFSRVDATSFLELLYKNAHELGLNTEVDSQKFKLTLKTPVAEAATDDEDELENIFEARDVEMEIKIAKVEGQDDLIVARAIQKNGSRFDFRKLFMEVRAEMSEIVE